MEEIPVALIGHKDHGKSTLIGRVLLDTGSIKKSKLEEIKEIDRSVGQKFELAHLVDSFKEERENEMTIDTTRALIKGKKNKNYQLIDVPGHEELISNMLTGVAGVKIALLLVSIEEGIKKQTCQHLEIAHLLGVEKIAVLINKMDKVAYNEKKFKEIKQEIEHVLNTTGYSLDNINIFPVSAKEGDNIV